MKKNRKRASARLLSVLMTLAMIVSMLPATAFAAETNGDGAAALTEISAADNYAANDEANDEAENEVTGDAAVDEAENADATEPAKENAATDAEENNASDAADDEEAAALETEQNSEEQPAEGETYTQTYSSSDYADSGIQTISYNITSTDANGAKLADGKGEISMVNAAGEFVGQLWTRTDRCNEWKNIVSLLKDQGVNVDSRKVDVFDLDMTDSEGEAVELDFDKTQITVNAEWFGSAKYKVYLYNGETLTEETAGEHFVVDYGEMIGPSFEGMFAGTNQFTLPAGYKVVFASEFVNVHEALAPGAYTVDADLTVLGKNNQVLSGIQVYLSNPALPPTSPMKQKGYLVVKNDGTMTLSLDGFNHIFSQQTITSSSDVKVDELRYFNLRDYWTENATSEEEKEQYQAIPEKCIDGITVTLDNYNGYYSFGDCTQYPVILFGYTDMLLDLTVDFSSAVAAYTRPENSEDEYTKTFTDSSTGISVKVDTTEEWGSKLADASMEIKYLKEGDEGYEDARFQVERLCLRDNAKLIGFVLKDNEGNEITVDGNSQATVSGVDVSSMENPYMWQLYGDVARSKVISTDTENGKSSFTVRNLNTIALVDKYVKSSDSYVYGGALPFVWQRSESKDNTYSLTEYLAEADASVDSEYGQTVSSTYLTNSVYSGAMRMVSGESGDAYYAKLDDGDIYTQPGVCKVEVQLPYDESKPYYYFVMTDGTNTYVRQFTDTTIRDGSVYFDIVNSIGKQNTYVFSKDDGSAFNQDFTIDMIQALANGYDNAAASASKHVAYILNSDKLYAGQPILTGKKSSTQMYTGKPQTMTDFVYNDTVVFENSEAVEAGEHTMTVKPAEGRTWLDGTTEPVEYKWSIQKAYLYARYEGEAIYDGQQPKLSLNLTGWVNDETPETAAGYVAPTIQMPEKLEVGQSYTLKPEGGSADNYEIKVLNSGAGTLTVLEDNIKIVDKPTAVSGILLADGNEVTGVPEGEGYTLSGDWKASKGGRTYVATATLNDGYCWSDGTNQAAKVIWTLYKPVEKPVFTKNKITETGKFVSILIENGIINSIYSSSVEGWSADANYRAVKCGDYTTKISLFAYYAWPDGSRDDVYVDWSIVAKESDNTGGNTSGDSGNNGGSSSGGSSDGTAVAEKTEKAIANLYVPGDFNKQLPGVTAYLTNPDNPVGTASSNVPDGWTFKSIAPTSPMNVNNAVLKTDKNGKKTLTVQICNPVFTLQSIKGTSSNGGAKVIETKTEKGSYGEKTSRITEVTFEILKDADSYVFESCTEYPTLLNTQWDVPLTLVINNVDKLPDKDGSKVDTGSTGGGSGTATTPTDQNGNAAATGKFKDVPDSSYYKKAVDWAVEKNVTAGAADDTFAPEKVCTRAQTVTFLWRAAGSSEPTSTVNPFTDVSSDAYYYKAVLWAVEKGITKGMTATTFAPEKTVTRGQVVTFQWRLAGSPAVEGADSFADVASDSYCGDAVKWAAKNGITSGKSATAFAPEEGCTRAQIVTFLYRQLGASAEK